MHGPTVGCQGGAVSYERGTHVGVFLTTKRCDLAGRGCGRGERERRPARPFSVDNVVPNRG